MFGTFDEHIEHLIGDVFDLIAFNLVDEPVKDLLFDSQVTCNDDSKNAINSTKKDEMNERMDLRTRTEFHSRSR